MRWYRSGHRTNGRLRGVARAGFTLVEILIGLAVFSVVALIAYTLLRSGMVLLSQNLALNLSAARARNDLDRMQEALRFSDNVPTLINADGTTATGTTADGVLSRRFIGGPYILKEQNGGNGKLSGTETSFQISYSVHPMASPPVPQAGDFFLVELSSQPRLEVVSVLTNQGQSGNRRALKVTTSTGLGVAADPGAYRISSYLYRQEAFVFSGGSGSYELRHYNRVTSSQPVGTSTNYQVLARNCTKLGTTPFFERVTVNGKEGTRISFLTRSERGRSYLENRTGTENVSSIPVELTIFPSDA